MTDLDRAMRTLLDDRARRTPPLPDPAPTVHRTRRRQAVVLLTALAVTVAVGIGSLVGVSALVRSAQQPIPADRHVAPAPLACPAGSTPNLPGPAGQDRPRTYTYGSMAFDPSAHRMMLLTRGQGVWSFDVCTNIWSRQARADGLTDARVVFARLVFDVDSATMLAVQRDSTYLRVWAYDTAHDSWARKVQVDTRFNEQGFINRTPSAVYDASTGKVILRDVLTRRMWTYDVDTDAWSGLDQGTTTPWKGSAGPQLLTDDTTVDRLVFYIGDQTWTFDVAAGRWTEASTDTPAGAFGWIPSGDEMVFDASAGVSLLAAGPTLATFDASRSRWAVLSTDGPNPAGSEYPMAYDSLNHRVVTAHDDVVAYDVTTGNWTTLLASAR